MIINQLTIVDKHSKESDTIMTLLMSLSESYNYFIVALDSIKLKALIIDYIMEVLPIKLLRGKKKSFKVEIWLSSQDEVNTTILINVTMWELTSFVKPRDICTKLLTTTNIKKYKNKSSINNVYAQCGRHDFIFMVSEGTSWLSYPSRMLIWVPPSIWLYTSIHLILMKKF